MAMTLVEAAKLNSGEELAAFNLADLTMREARRTESENKQQADDYAHQLHAKPALSPADDRGIALRVHERVRELNAALRDAGMAGIEVDLGTIRHQTIGSVVGTRIISCKTSKVIE